MPRIPRDVIDGIESAGDIADLLDAHWTAARVRPMLGLSYRQIDAELEHFRHGAGELSEASEAF